MVWLSSSICHQPIHVMLENSLFYRSGAQFKITRYFSRKIEQLIIIKIKLFQQIVARIHGVYGRAWHGMVLWMAKGWWAEGSRSYICGISCSRHHTQRQAYIATLILNEQINWMNRTAQQPLSAAQVDRRELPPRRLAFIRLYNKFKWWLCKHGIKLVWLITILYNVYFSFLPLLVLSRTLRLVWE